MILSISLSGIRQQKPSSPVPSPEKSSPNKSPPVQVIKGFNPNAPTFVPMALQNQRPANVSLHIHVHLFIPHFNIKLEIVFFVSTSSLQQVLSLELLLRLNFLCLAPQGVLLSWAVPPSSLRPLAPCMAGGINNRG